MQGIGDLGPILQGKKWPCRGETNSSCCTRVPHRTQHSSTKLGIVINLLGDFCIDAVNEAINRFRFWDFVDENT
jgi:hypothetical protein